MDNVRHAYLGLEGTILSFDQRQAAIDSELLIPVELVTISQGLRFKGRRLVAALLCLLLPMLLCGVIWGLFSGWSPTAEIEGTLAAGILAGLSAGMLLAGFVAFLILLIMFFFRVKDGPAQDRAGRRSLLSSTSSANRRPRSTISSRSFGCGRGLSASRLRPWSTGPPASRRSSRSFPASRRCCGWPACRR